MLVNQTATPELRLPVKKTTMKVTDTSQGLTQSAPSGVQNICHHATPIPTVKRLSCNKWLYSIRGYVAFKRYDMHAQIIFTASDWTLGKTHFLSVETSVTHSAIASCATFFCSYHILTSSVIYY